MHENSIPVIFLRSIRAGTPFWKSQCIGGTVDLILTALLVALILDNRNSKNLPSKPFGLDKKRKKDCTDILCGSDLLNDCPCIFTDIRAYCYK